MYGKLPSYRQVTSKLPAGLFSYFMLIASVLPRYHQNKNRTINRLLLRVKKNNTRVLIYVGTPLRVPKNGNLVFRDYIHEIIGERVVFTSGNLMVKLPFSIGGAL